MWSLTSLRTKRISSSKKFRLLPSKAFFDSIGQSRKSRHVRAMSVSPSGADFVQAFLASRRSDEFDDPDLRFRVSFDVTLRGPKVRVSGQHLDIPERPANSRYLPSGIGDESATTAVT